MKKRDFIKIGGLAAGGYDGCAVPHRQLTAKGAAEVH